MLFANLKHHSQNGIIKKQMHGKWWHLYKEDQSLTPEMSRMLQHSSVGCSTWFND